MPILETCYMCDSIATTREHVPPKCLFPEKKDIGDDIYRQNLITVPSCDKHNTSKSQEYNPGNTDVVVRLKKNQVLSIYYDGLSDESTEADDAKLIFTEYK